MSYSLTVINTPIENELSIVDQQVVFELSIQDNAASLAIEASLLAEAAKVIAEAKALETEASASAALISE